MAPILLPKYTAKSFPSPNCCSKQMFNPPPSLTFARFLIQIIIMRASHGGKNKSCEQSHRTYTTSELVNRRRVQKDCALSKFCASRKLVFTRFYDQKLLQMERRGGLAQVFSPLSPSPFQHFDPLGSRICNSKRVSSLDPPGFGSSRSRTAVLHIRPVPL